MSSPAAEVEAALRDGVLAACVGPVTATRLAMGVPTVRPKRARLGALVREIDAVVVDGQARERYPDRWR